jgi:hypothetical protein
MKTKTTIISLALISSTLFSCATQNNNTNSVTTGQAEDLFIVDCLLPSQVRRLGQIATYLTARRAIKTTALDCGVRGGEYVAYNQANHATALKIWLPKAQAGDPQAQNYVGEIYDKGLGITPDYEIAQVWYKKAARQGYSKAQMNLGYLYEKGLGVQKNQATAIEWYSKSSKLSKENIPYTVSLTSAQESTPLSAELKLLKSTLKNSQAETNNLKNKLANVQSNLLTNKEKLALLQKDFISVQKKIQHKTTGTAQNNQQTILLKQSLINKTQEIKEQQSNIEKLEKQYNQKITVLTEKLTETQKRAHQVVAGLKKENNHAGKFQIALLQVEAKLAETEKRLLEVNERSHQQLTELDKVKQTAGTGNKSLQIAEQKLKQTQQQIQQYKQEKNLLSAQVASDHTLKDKYLLTIDDKSSEVDQLKNTLVAERQRYEKEITQLKKDVETETTANSEKPVIEIIDPPFTLTRGVPTITLRSVIQQREIVGKVNASAGLLLLTVNDLKRPVDDKGLFKTPIKLRGKETPIQIVAIDNNGKKASLNFVLSLEKAIQRASIPSTISKIKPEKNWQQLDFGNYHALIIANNDYKKVPKLETPISDGKAVEKILRSKYGFKTKLLINGTRYQILSELNKLRASLTKEDNLLVYYAGHGELDKVNMRGHWLPIDADADNTANWISTVAITDVLNSMAAQHIMVVSDSCYSGAMTRSSLARLDTGMGKKQRNDWLKAMLKAKSRTVLTSGGLQPVMDGGGDQHSVFAQAFIKTLSGNHQLLEGQALYREVSNNIIAIAADYGIEQVPEYAPIRHAGHEAGEFFFVPQNNN